MNKYKQKIPWLQLQAKHYEDKLKAGETWCREPYIVICRWIELLEINQIGVADCATLRRDTIRCLEEKLGDLAFHGICNSILSWYKELLKNELDEVDHIKEGPEQKDKG